MEQDKLVNAIFTAIRNQQASPRERLNAVIRAGLICQAYAGWSGENTVDEILFSLSSNSFENDKDLLVSAATGSH